MTEDGDMTADYYEMTNGAITVDVSGAGGMSELSFDDGSDIPRAVTLVAVTDDTVDGLTGSTTLTAMPIHIVEGENNELTITRDPLGAVRARKP